VPGGDHPDRKLARRRRGSRDGIDHDEQHRPDDHRDGQQAPVIGADEKAAHVRHHHAHEADASRDGDHAADQDRRDEKGLDPEPGDVDPQ
jgi:hypothetical protein